MSPSGVGDLGKVQKVSCGICGHSFRGRYFKVKTKKTPYTHSCLVKSTKKRKKK